VAPQAGVTMIFYRYIARKFWPPFLFGMGVFAVLVFLADMFEKLKYITRTEAPVSVILKYFLLVIPFWTLVIVPVATLLGALFVVSGLIKSGEWIAAVASGYSPRQVVAPILACAVIVAAGNAVLQEYVSPILHYKSEKVLQRDIRQDSEWDNKVRENVVIKAGDGVMLYISRYESGPGLMRRPIANISKDGKTKFQIDAAKAVWDKDVERWVFYDGVLREMTGVDSVKEKVFGRYVSDISITPGDVIVEKVWPEDLTMRDVSARIKSLGRTGSPDYRERTYLHAKLAAPFASLVICMLGIPFGIIVRRGGKLVHFASAMVITFVFWWVISMCQSAGEAGMISPLLAAWGPVAVFGGGALFGMKKAGL